MDNSDPPTPPWYHGITSYQWLVLIIASLGWVFDVFEGQIFVASMNEAMPSLLTADGASTTAQQGAISFYNNIALAAFLLGGALGGVLFGRMSDRIGRTRTMIVTIATYSLFTCISALSQVWWHLVVCRFLVALGVGGEWAVASALVAEVFPKAARARSLAIFHASSVLGTLMASAAGTLLIPDYGWRVGFLLGGVPALLIIWVRLSLREPDSWQKAALSRGVEQGSLSALLRPPLARSTLVGIGLAAVGLATFWGVHIYGKDLLRRAQEQSLLADMIAGDVHQPSFTNEDRADFLKPHAASIKRWEMLGMILVTVGGGVGLVSFGPVCERFGRRGGFLIYQIGGLLASLILFQLVADKLWLLLLLPVFGFLTLGMHAGFAVYFPELFPTRLRGTGAGVCFNMGRLIAAPILFVSGWLQKDLHFTPEDAASWLSLLFLAGIVLLAAAPETRGRELPT